MYRIKFQYETTSGPVGDHRAVDTFDPEALHGDANPRPKSLVTRTVVVTGSFNCPDANLPIELADAITEATRDGGRLVMLEAVFDDGF